MTVKDASGRDLIVTVDPALLDQYVTSTSQQHAASKVSSKRVTALLTVLTALVRLRLFAQKNDWKAVNGLLDQWRLYGGRAIQLELPSSALLGNSSASQAASG